MLAQLAPAQSAALEAAVRVATARGLQLWLVGGVLRDRLLDRPASRDLDLALSGDALGFATELAAACGGRVTAAHPAFGTASLWLPHGALQLDLAQTRAETYPRPAALPEVRPAPIELDLARRDFSVNALACALFASPSGLSVGPLLDPFGGQADLAARRLRLLHPASLRDDPTRILRGLRLAVRLHLEPEPGTQALIAAALAADYLGLLSAERVLAELCLGLDEPDPAALVQQADAWKLTAHLVPGLCWQPALADRAARLVAAGTAAPLTWAGVLLYDLRPAELAALAQRYPLPSGFAALVAALPALRAVAPSLSTAAPSALDRSLHSYSPAALNVLGAAEPQVAATVANYLQTIRPARPLLTGDDLRRLGVPPGPQMGQLLAALRAATLDGQVTNRAAAERWVLGRI